RAGAGRRGARVAEPLLGPHGRDGADARAVDARLRQSEPELRARLPRDVEHRDDEDQGDHRERDGERADLPALARLRLQEPGRAAVPRPVRPRHGRRAVRRPREADEAALGRDRHRVRRPPPSLRAQLLRRPREHPLPGARRRRGDGRRRPLPRLRRAVHGRVRPRRLDGPGPDQPRRRQRRAEEPVRAVSAAAPMTGDEYLASLRDGRDVWIYGERVGDVTAHPAFRNAARSVARLYDALHDPARKDVLTVETDTGSGGFTHPFFRAPRSAADLVRGRDAIAEWQRMTYGWMGRSPDYKAAFLATYGPNADYYAPYDENA